MRRMTSNLKLRSHDWVQYERVIVFDGVCNWCNAWVNFTIDHDPQGKFKFGTLQSENGQRILKDLQLSTDDFETFLLLEGPHVFTKSTAALRVVRHLSGVWPFYYLGMLIPRPLRDWLYNVIARHRYTLMGKSEACRVPPPEQRGRFL